MSVIQTKQWLYEFINRCKEKSILDYPTIQRETLCDPLKKVFPNIAPQSLHHELLNHGLFDPFEWFKIETVVEKMEELNVWKIVQKEYKKLKKLWNGPNVPIYIFPIKGMGFKRDFRKNGVAYKEGVFLFFSNSLSETEIKAMFAHEYNHVCRIHLNNLSLDQIPLKESIIIEGLGEYAIKDLYGEKFVGPWTNLYSYEQSLEIWKRYFLTSLYLKGLKNHYPFLYGQKGSPLPKWIGYHIGYQIINSYQEKNGPFKNDELYRKSSDTIISGSKFPKE
ncbi:DUF2268 domain-containing protein [uncultured Rummeliibacillus sp.]|uniref:DUF2268 domain-containing protein n=1 Tax=uncultured Rummeliibacillus sp. TaxID=762292 RepID=UPI0026355B62|nr:DUF2268 domain-containing putative Zn-dependent protease [uncultured Rummeliibacillus sp.]